MVPPFSTFPLKLKIGWKLMGVFTFDKATGFNFRNQSPGHPAADLRDKRTVAMCLNAFLPCAFQAA